MAHAITLVCFYVLRFDAFVRAARVTISSALLLTFTDNCAIRISVAIWTQVERATNP